MPTVFYINKETENIVSVWKITENEDKLIKMLPYSDKIISEVKKYRNHSKKLEWLASRVLLYKYTGIIPDVKYTETGQPYIQGFNNNISITHTAGYAAVTISESKAGIDIECPHERIKKIAERFIHPEEFCFIPHDEEVNYFTLIWCAKETLFKMINKTGIIFNKELIIMPFKIENEGILKAKAFQSEYLLSYIITSDFILVWHC